MWLVDEERGRESRAGVLGAVAALERWGRRSARMFDLGVPVGQLDMWGWDSGKSHGLEVEIWELYPSRQCLKHGSREKREQASPRPTLRPPALVG